MSDNEKRNERLDETTRLESAEVKELLEKRAPENNISVNQPIEPSQIHFALEKNDSLIANGILRENSVVSLADALNALTDAEVISFFLLSTDYQKQGEIYSYLSVEERVALLNNLPRRNLSLLFVSVQNDDLADFVEDLTPPQREKVLGFLPRSRRQVINSLAQYSADTVGSVMTTEYLAVPPNTVIKDIFKKIHDSGKQYETVRTIFVTDGNNVLLGTQRLEALMFEDENATIETSMAKDFPYISPISDKAEAIPICEKYDLPVLPVISKNKDMLGIITFDDVLDVVTAESTEDVFKQAAVQPMEKPYLETPAYKLAFSYVLWLIILLVLNTFTGMLISNFETALLAWPILIAFVPALADSCGDAGDQTNSVVIRSLATREIGKKDFPKVIGKELAAGFLTALLVAVFNFGWVMMELNTPLLRTTDDMRASLVTYFGTVQNGYMVIAGIVSLAFLFGVTFAKFFAAILPMIAKAFKLDPAVMSGPLIASLMDILTLLIYFTIAMTVLQGVDPGLFSKGMMP